MYEYIYIYIYMYLRPCSTPSERRRRPESRSCASLARRNFFLRVGCFVRHVHRLSLWLCGCISLNAHVSRVIGAVRCAL